MPVLVLPFPAFDPVLVSIGPVAVRWYALAYIGGILFGWLYARALIRAEELWGGKPPLTLGDIDDFILWVTLGIIFGGRLGYVLFYNPAHFATHPLEILQLWTGGMSFHGGFLGCVAAVMLFAWKRNIRILSLLDVMAATTPIGLFLGRIANFINAELWGRATDVPWAVIFCNDMIRAMHGGVCPAGEAPRHPSQLYEAVLEGLVLFVVLYMLIRGGALRRPGLILGAFALIYSLARGFSEFFREPDKQLGFLFSGMTMGMLLSIPLALAGIILIAQAMRRQPQEA